MKKRQEKQNIQNRVEKMKRRQGGRLRIRLSIWLPPWRYLTAAILSLYGIFAIFGKLRVVAVSHKHKEIIYEITLTERDTNWPSIREEKGKIESIAGRRWEPAQDPRDRH